MFQRWTMGNPQRDGKLFVRFGGMMQIHLSTGLTKSIQKESKGEPSFNIYVDEENRLIGFVPVSEGEFKIRMIPSSYGMADFIDQYNPVIDKRLPVRWQDGCDSSPGMWVAHMDGKAPNGS